MAYYGRLQATLEISDYSDYAQAMKGRLSSTWTPDEFRFRSVIEAQTTGTTIELGNLTTITGIFVENLDATNFVEVTHTYVKETATATAGDITYADANPDTITSAGDINFATAGFVVPSKVTISGSSTIANDGTRLVQVISAGVITVAAGAALLGGNEAAGTPTFTCDIFNREKVPASKFLHIHSIKPGDDLVLTADTAACACRVTVFGT